MKRLIAILLAVMVLTAVFTACSGTAYYDDGMGYGNVSTTPNGRVNGGEGTNGTNNGVFGNVSRGNYGSSMMPGTNGRTDGRGMYNGQTSGRSTINGDAGTGMTGGR